MKDPLSAETQEACIILINSLQQLISRNYPYKMGGSLGQWMVVPFPDHCLIGFFINKDWDNLLENSGSLAKPAAIFSDHFPILLEAGAIIWGPSPFRFCNSWLLSNECNLLIEETVTNFTHHGWAGFILHEQWRKIKVAVKIWHSTT